MAANDTAALVVALSAQVSKFQKDMDQAVSIATKSTKDIETKFQQLSGQVQKNLGGLAQGFAGQLGFLGTALQAIGPLGLAAAAGVGAVVVAMNFLAEKTAIFAEKVKALRELAEQTGLTGNQLKILIDVGKQVGVETEQSERFILRFIIALEKLRNEGKGELFDALARINVQFARQIVNAKDNIEALEILARAYKEAATQGQI